MKKPNFLVGKNIENIRKHKYERYLPTAFDESLSMLEKINKVIEFLYQYSKLTEEMIDTWNEVYNWVMNDGLDEMVGDRLNEWLENGTLHRIINEEIFKELNDKITDIEKTVDEKLEGIDEIIENKLKDIQNLFDVLSESILKDINKLKNDINKTISEFKKEVEEKVELKVDTLAYYHELDFETHRHSKLGTTYYLIKIPKYDSSGKPIVLKHGIANDNFSSVGSETVRQFSKRKGATMVANLSPSTTLARIIHKGKILQDTQSIDHYRPTLAFDNQGNFRSYPNTVSAQTILNDGYTEAMTTFFNLINNGNINHTEINATSDTLKGVNPRTAVGKNRNGEIVIFVSDGRRLGERGFTALETAQVLLSHDLVFAQMLDGGGSTQATMYHTNINKLSERQGSRKDGWIVGQHERLRSNFLYVGKDIKDDPLTTILAHLGDINKNRDDRLSEYENLQYTSTNWVELGGYLVNGWEQYSGSGANAVRGWIMPNNTFYMVGNIKGGKLGEPFMKLPPEYRPNFAFSFVVSGRQVDTVFRVYIQTNGDATLHALSGEREGKGVGYCKLDGIFFPINPKYNE